LVSDDAPQLECRLQPAQRRSRLGLTGILPHPAADRPAAGDDDRVMGVDRIGTGVLGGWQLVDFGAGLPQQRQKLLMLQDRRVMPRLGGS
jgi:hypothetical protein